MSSLVQVSIHRSQFPEQVRCDLIESLRSRQVNHKFHYDSIKQTRKWLALHQAYAPSRTDPDCARIYDQSFLGASKQFSGDHVHLIGLGCGGGQKDSRLLKLLGDSRKEVLYTPVDVSTAMVLTAAREAAKVIGEENCFPVVCDLATSDDLPAVFQSRIAAGTPRILTFFGMIPNFEPEMILPKLAGLVGRNDLLLFSANLAPGPDYAAGINKILPLYDNPLTRDWLLTFLLDLGVEPADGELIFSIEDDPAGSGLKRIAATFSFSHSRTLQVDSNNIDFQPGEAIRLFFSYRHTPALIRTQLKKHGLQVTQEWITNSEEEGVFFVGALRKS